MHSRLILSALFFLGWPAAARAQTDLFVSSRFTDEVLHYDAASGAFLGVFATGGGLDNPVGLTFGPDGALYVASGESDQVLRYDGTSGAFLDVFAQGGGLDGPRQVNFGPDGELYVASGATDAVLRYDGRTGAFLGVFASGGNLRGPTSFCFGPDGDLFVVSVLNDRIKRYDGRSGAYLGNFVATNLNGPHDLAFDTRVRRFDRTSGAFLDVFIDDAELSAPLGLSWDEQGVLYVVNQGGDEVRRYDGLTGAFLGTLVAPGAGGLSAPLFAVFEPRRGLQVHAPRPGLAGQLNLVVSSGATPGALLGLGIGDRPLAWLAPDCGSMGLPASLAHFALIADESGRAFLSAFVPASAAGCRLFLRAIEPAACAASSVILSRF